MSDQQPDPGLANSPNENGEDLRSSILNQLKSDWHHQTARSLQAYCQHQPSLASDDDFLLDLVYTDVLCRESAGRPVEPKIYVEQFPHLSEAIKRQLLVHRQLIDQSQDQSSDVRDRENLGRAPSHETLPVDSVRQWVTHADIKERAHTSEWPSIPGFQIEAELGRGGMGVVYKAQQHQLKRTVAIKMLRQQGDSADESLTRLRSEAEAIAKLRHPNIVQIFNAAEYHGSPYLVLEYIDGENLVNWCQTPRSVPTIVRLIELVARAVEYAHQQRIVHRDLKPANILLAYDGDQLSNSNQHSQTNLLDDVTAQYWQPKIADFGLAKQIHSEDQQLTRTQAILGTAAYLSPEQAWGRSREVCPATDVHALGVIAYELLTGHSPFQGESLIHTLDNVRFVQPVPPSTLNDRVPEWLDRICERCLEKDPLHRFSSAQELADCLAHQASDHPVTLVAKKSNYDSDSDRRTHRVRTAGQVGNGRNVWFFATMGILFCGVLIAIVRGGLRSSGPGTNADSSGLAGASASPYENGAELRGPVPPRTEGTHRAFLVGVRAYQFPNGPVQLKYTEADVDEMSRVLYRRGFAREHIQLMTQWSQVDNPKLAPSAGNLRVQLQQFLSSSIEDDTVVIMLTGMGGETQPQGSYFYLPSDANLDNRNSILSLNELLQLLAPCRARKKLLVIDTCQTVSLPGVEFSTGPMPPGTAVLLACSAAQVSYEDDTLRHGVFSHFLLRALEGEADRDGDLTIGLGELLEFTRRHVQSFVSTNRPGGEQTPVLIGTLPLDTKLTTKFPKSL